MENFGLIISEISISHTYTHTLFTPINSDTNMLLPVLPSDDPQREEVMKSVDIFQADKHKHTSSISLLHNVSLTHTPNTEDTKFNSVWKKVYKLH